MFLLTSRGLTAHLAAVTYTCTPLLGVVTGATLLTHPTTASSGFKPRGQRNTNVKGALWSFLVNKQNKLHCVNPQTNMLNASPYKTFSKLMKSWSKHSSIVQLVVKKLNMVPLKKQFDILEKRFFFLAES